MKTFEKHPHLIDECECGSLKAKAAKRCRKCFILWRTGKERWLDWTKWVSAC